MKLHTFVIGGLVSLVLLGASSVTTDPPDLTDKHPVADLLETLGDDPSAHRPNTNLEGVSVERGRDIVLVGRSRSTGKKSRRQSKHFTCTACHNVEREDPDLANPDPVARLSYVEEMQLPFLQGSPLYGVVNRTSFYNGDYDKKYGDLVKPTRNNLREAIQLCAIECSQGRPLADFEMESVLAYLWTIGLTLGDLHLDEQELETVKAAFHSGKGQQKAIDIIKSKYLPYAPATFLDPPADRRTGDGLQGDADNGKRIYELSCQHCHLNHKYSFLVLDNDRQTFQHLLKQAGKYTAHSIYQVIRYGTPPKGGKKAYMPQYTAEKMTDQQMADLRAYIDEQAK